MLHLLGPHYSRRTMGLDNYGRLIVQEENSREFEIGGDLAKLGAEQ